MKRVIYLALGACAAILYVMMFRPRQLAADQLATTTVTFNREIVGLLNSHCVMCHNQNGLSFPLETYEQTFFKGDAIRASVLSRQMPPWSAVSGYGEFNSSNRLTAREIQFVLSWVDGGGPRTDGSVFLNVIDPKSVPSAEVRAHADFSDWQLGKPSLVRPFPQSTIDASQPSTIKHAVIDLGLTKESRLRGLEYRPSDRRVVTAAIFTLQETGQWLGSWTPWYGFVDLPPGLAYHLPAGSHVAAEIHYRGTKEPVVEKGMLGLFFTERPSSKLPTDLVLDAQGETRPGARAQRFHAEIKLATDTNVLSLRPDVNFGIKSVEVDAEKPDGDIEILLFTKDISVDWPTPYILKHPISLPSGTLLSVTAYSANDTGTPQPGGVRLTVSEYQGKQLESPDENTQPNTPSSQAQAESAMQHYALEGTIQSVDASKRTVLVQHNAIPGFMPAMTMQYDVGKQEDLTKVSAGDQVQADLVVRGTEMHLENIRAVAHSK